MNIPSNLNIISSAVIGTESSVIHLTYHALYTPLSFKKNLIFQKVQSSLTQVWRTKNKSCVFATQQFRGTNWIKPNVENSRWHEEQVQWTRNLLLIKGQQSLLAVGEQGWAMSWRTERGKAQWCYDEPQCTLWKRALTYLLHGWWQKHWGRQWGRRQLNCCCSLWLFMNWPMESNYLSAAFMFSMLPFIFFFSILNAMRIYFFLIRLLLFC